MREPRGIKTRAMYGRKITAFTLGGDFACEPFGYRAWAAARGPKDRNEDRRCNTEHDADERYDVQYRKSYRYTASPVSTMMNLICTMRGV